MPLPQRHCARALFHLSSSLSKDWCAEHPERSTKWLRHAMVEQGALSSLAMLGRSSHDEVRLVAVSSLCNLSSEEGLEEYIVSRGGLAAAMHRLNRATDPDLVLVVAVMLLNLSATAKRFARVEAVIEATVEMLKLGLSVPDWRARTEAIALRAICNLACHR